VTPKTKTSSCSTSPRRALPPVDFAAILTDYTLLSDGIYIDDLAALEDPGPMEQKLLAAGLRAIAAIDLRPRETPGGFLVAAYRQPQQFTESDDRYLNTIADGASVVFSNIVLFDQIQNTLEETSILYQASRALSDAVTPEDILDVVVNYLIQPHVGQVFIAMLRSRAWDADGATVEIVSSWHDGEGIDLTGITMTAEQFPAWGKLATLGSADHRRHFR
jgi:hypothetical protein